MAYNHVIAINGTWLPEPAKMDVGIQDVDYDSGRNQNGDMIRDRVAVKRKVSCVWQGLKKTEVSSILSAISSVKFTLTYPDPLTGDLKDITAYVGDRTTPMWTMINGEWQWETLSANFVEY